jgi:hypothetical protein
MDMEVRRWRMAQANQAVQTSGKIPFRYGSRRRIQRVGFIPFQENQVAPPLQLPNVGYLAGIFLTWRGVISGTGVSPRLNGPWDIIRRLRLNLNLGSASVVDVSGYGLYLFNLLNGADMLTNQYYGGIARWTLYVPVSANLGENFSTGLILLQDPQIRATVEINWNSLANVFNGSGLSAAAGSGVEVHYVYWEVPDLSKVSQPPLVLHRIVEDTQPITQTGDNTYLVPRQGILLQLLHVLILNANYSSLWDRAFIRLNRVDTIAEMAPDVFGALHVLNVDVPATSRPPTHTIPWDFFSPSYKAGMGDLRDAIDTEAVTTIESVVTVSGSATLGANNNFLGTVRRILQPIQP